MRMAVEAPVRPLPPAAEAAGVPLRESCVTTALAVIAEHGLDKLSLREVARRLGVSHQAPYKHYPSRDHLLAEVVRRCYARFNAVMDAATADAADPMDAMRRCGESYLRFAMEHPLEYRLMFGDPLPDPEAHPEMLAEAHIAFDALRASVAAVVGLPPDHPQIMADALFVWSTVHGFAMIRQTDALGCIGLGDTDEAALAGAVLGNICAALTAKAAPR
jgi:AcrR family transcriptional regulator